ncbi:MAG: class I SAM-dependent methyltransferase [Thermomicrobiales bacterium]
MQQVKQVQQVQEAPRIQQVQELAHAADFDYRDGSPHLKHDRLFATLVGWLRAELVAATARDLPPTLLDIGAGDGAFVAPALAAGFRVTATEMSRPAIAKLERRFAGNPAFTARFVAGGAADPIGEADGRFSVVLCASVLHHIPDYLATIEQTLIHHMEPGGAFVSFQDPLWYPSMGRGTRLFSEAAYLSWRLARGNYRRGVATRWRHRRGVYDDANLSDTAEYHVVRQGVDHERLVEFLLHRFDDVVLSPYWSTHAGFWQRAGERIGAANTFAAVARGYRGRVTVVRPDDPNEQQQPARISTTSPNGRSVVG